MNYGTSRRIMRDKLPIRVVSGFHLSDTDKRTHLAAPKDDADIKSGQILTIHTDGTFIQTVAEDKTKLTKQFYIAYYDDDAHSVQNSGKLLALDCTDTYTVQIGYFASATYAVGDELTVGDNGVVQKAAAGDRVIGVVTTIPGAFIPGTKVDPASGNTIPVKAEAWLPQNHNATDTATIEFKTVWYVKAATQAP